MRDDGTRFWGRLFSKPDSAGMTRRPASRSDRVELPIDRPTVGLCFDYERDLNFDSPHLSDAGLSHILDALARRRLRATFHCAAKLCETNPDQIHAVAEAGHELAVYGYCHELPNQLSRDDLKQMVFRCRNAFAKLNLYPIGFRSPQSKWDQRLCEELVLQRFRYNAEHDHAKRPYVIVPGDPELVRVPVCTDDSWYVRHPEKATLVLSKHHRYLRKAASHGHFVAIAFHPWILAEEQRRMDDWQEWLDTAVQFGARIGALEDALPARYRGRRPMDDAEE